MELKDFYKPKKILWDKETLTDFFGRFYAEPFELGFGTTMGNALRRVLLSSIQGAAPISVRIEGVKHEFSSLEGVREDIPDVILNLKGLNFKLLGVPMATVTLDVKGARDVRGSDLKLDSRVVLMNPDHYIAHLDKNSTLSMELRVAMGRGYIASQEFKQGEDEQLEVDEQIGLVYMDAAFSPVRRVNYYVEPARVEKRTEYDRLIMEVTTNGAVTPQEAVSYAARLLQDHLQLFVTVEEEVRFVQEREEKEEEEVATLQELEEKLNKSIEELELSVRSFNCLQAAGIKTIRDLVQKSEQEMLKYRNFGRKSLQEIRNILGGMGLQFNMRFDEQGRPIEMAESVAEEEED